MSRGGSNSEDDIDIRRSSKDWETLWGCRLMILKKL